MTYRTSAAPGSNSREGIDRVYFARSKAPTRRSTDGPEGSNEEREASPAAPHAPSSSNASLQRGRQPEVSRPRSGGPTRKNVGAWRCAAYRTTLGPADERGGGGQQRS